MHFVNASQIGPRKFIGTLGHKNPEILRSPIKQRKDRGPHNEGSCTKAVAWIHIVSTVSVLNHFHNVSYL